MNILLPFEITAEDIARLNAFEFADVMNRLLRAEADRIGLPQTSVQTTLRINDKDAGVDARVRDVPHSSRSWFPQGESVWQFKSGTDHEPADLKKEFHKDDVQEALRQGSRYHIAIKERLGPRQPGNRKKALRECCQKMGIPEERCQLLTAEQVAHWVSEHLAFCFLPYFGRPVYADFLSWHSWAQDHRFTNEFKSDQQRRDIIAAVLRCAHGQSNLLHVRIEGLAGVGKTRLALEALRGEAVGGGLSDRVMYALRPQDRPPGLFHWLEAHPNKDLILVVDECDRHEMEFLIRQAERCQGRLRLITIGLAQEARRADRSRPDVFLLDTLASEAMQELLRAAAPTLPREGIDFAVNMASGYVKMARAIVDGLQTQREKASAYRLTQIDDVQQVIKQFLVPDPIDHRTMQAVALLSRVGWEGELVPEGEAVTAFMRVEWRDAQLRLSRLERNGLVAKQGRYRYVTPHLLAIWLAAEVWESCGLETLALLPQLPSFGSRRALLERLRDLGDAPQAKQVAEQLLGQGGLFPDLAAISDEGRAEVFHILTEAQPEAGLRALQRILEHLPRDELQSWRTGRRQIIWALEKLAWLPQTFFGAARLLLQLAEAENESWGNNATEVWRGLFGVFLGGTVVPAVERHLLIEEALDGPSLERRLLGVQAIWRILARDESRISGAEQQVARVVPPEWHPQDPGEARMVRLSGLTLLDRALRAGDPKLQAAARNVLFQSSQDLVRCGLADAAIERLQTLPIAEPDQRREVLEIVENLLEFNSNSLDARQNARLTTLREWLVERSFSARLRRWTGERPIRRVPRPTESEERTPQQEAATLAEEAMRSPELLTPEMAWLASEQAHYVYPFAHRLGELDARQQVWTMIEARIRAGTGYPLASAYLQGQLDAGRQHWRDAILRQWVEEDPPLAAAVLDAVWRGSLSDADSERLVTLLHQRRLTGGQLSLLLYGAATRPLSTGAFSRLASAVLSDESEGATTAAIGLLQQRLGDHPDEEEPLSSLVWQALDRPLSQRTDRVSNRTWSDLAHRVQARDPVRVVRAILRRVEGEEISLSEGDEIAQVLAAATHRNPEAVWEVVAGHLLARSMASVRLSLGLRGWYGEIIGPEILLPWAERHQPEGPRMVADLTPIREGALSELARQLLIRFGPDKRIGGSLLGNYVAGTHLGSTSQFFDSKQETARTWLSDPAPRVRGWAQNALQALEAWGADERLHEAEARR